MSTHLSFILLACGVVCCQAQPLRTPSRLEPEYYVAAFPAREFAVQLRDRRDEEHGAGALAKRRWEQRTFDQHSRTRQTATRSESALARQTSAGCRRTDHREGSANDSGVLGVQCVVEND